MSDLFVPSRAERKGYKDMAVAIVTPCGDYEVAFKFARSVVNMVAYSWMHGLKVYQMGGTERMIVHWARNELAKSSLEHTNHLTGQTFTHLLWLDDDHVFNPDLALYLARNQHLDMVSALYYARIGKHIPVAYVKDDTDDKYRHFPLIQAPDGLAEVDAVGFGALLMRLDVLEGMEYPFFSFDRCGEDIYFCVKAKEKGFKVWLDGSYRLGHIGEPGIVTHQTHLDYLQANEELLADRIQVPLGGQNG